MDLLEDVEADANEQCVSQGGGLLIRRTKIGPTHCTNLRMYVDISIHMSTHMSTHTDRTGTPYQPMAHTMG